MSISVDLLVTVVCAKDLLPKDDNGLSDPYVVLKVGRTQCRTKVVRKSLNPTFNESFVLFAFSPSSKKRVFWCAHSNNHDHNNNTEK